MKVFGNYARYYDLLYQDKNYPAEASFIHNLIQTHAADAKNILELGCGTGNHALLLAKEGYQVCGVDLSEQMLQKANERLSHFPPELVSRLKFTQGDIRYASLHQTFDVVVSLFHVISYQATNQDLSAAFATVKQHLNPGGIFIFDVWYGPAVLTQQPQVRVKRLEDEEISVTRIAEPILYPNKNIVDVNYQVFIKNKKTEAVEELNETHRMRYLFQPEIELFLNDLGFKIINFGEWMSKANPGFNTWGVYFIAQL